MSATPVTSTDKDSLANGGFGLNDRATPTTCHRKGQAKEFQPAPGAPPPWPGFQPQTKASNLPRNLPVKRYDGDPLGRADVQHALLCHLFADTRRVFTNPRPASAARPAATSVTTSNGAGVPTPVWPYGTSEGCLRRSDETPEEFQQWKDTKARYDKWKRRMVRKENAERLAREKQAREAAAEARAADAEQNPSGDQDQQQQQMNEEEDELAGGGANDDDPDKPAEAAEAEEDLAVDESEPLDEHEFVQPGCEKLTFKELYIEALLNSGKCTKSMRDKVVTDQEYAEDFAKVCLLVNVGRINTTLAFYPEMKTVLRSYHPLPSVQNNENTRRNMQDAPRMKSLLKAVLLDTERPSAPTAGPGAGQPVKPPKANALSEEAPGDFKEVIKRYRDGTRPPTSVVTLIFLLSLHAHDITAFHFPQPHDSHALFYPHANYPLPARQRANSFLWLLYHYLEGPASQPPGEQENPFDDERSLHAAKLAREAWEGLNDEEKKKQTGMPWKGLVNPEWLKWKERDDKRREAAEAAELNKDKPKESVPPVPAAAPAAAAAAPVADVKQEDEGGSVTGNAINDTATDPDGDVSMKDCTSVSEAAKATNPDAQQQQRQPSPQDPIPDEEPFSHTHRLLLPALDIISYDQAARENIDTEEEITWGKQMQSERAAFLSKFQEEEAAKNAAGSQAAGSPAPSTGTAAGGGGGASRRKAGALKREEGYDRAATPTDADTTARRTKRIHPLATASSHGGGGGGGEKRTRLASIGYEDSPSPPAGFGAAPHAAAPPPSGTDDAVPAPHRIRPSLWSLDLHLPPHKGHESMPQMAWTRILDRAQRGVGDACYESDDDEFAQEEAEAGERSKGEVWRVLRCLRECVEDEAVDAERGGADRDRERNGRPLA